MISRRRFIASSAGLAALTTTFVAQSASAHHSHSNYFKSLSKALDEAQIAKPTLVIDKQKLLANITTLKQHIGDRFDYRVVAKSLPSLDLLKLITREADTNRLMVFHQPFANIVAKELPTSDVLIGKPMPVTAAGNFYRQLSDSRFDPSRQMQWLIDTPERLLQYRELAEALGVNLKVNIELDIGLHRGGVQSTDVLAQMLQIIEGSERLQFAGFMGYEPHIPSLPGDTLAHRDSAMAEYEKYIETAEQVLGRSIADTTLNCGGSPTYQLYDRGDFRHNELAAGSCLVKPTDFDRDTLADHQPASFIATPLLKTSAKMQLPGVSPEMLEKMPWWNPDEQRQFFIYGGYWKAKPVSPEGLQTNPVFGHSTNQEMYQGPNHIDLKPDDWIFFRPTQSEFVFLQFGDIAVYDEGEIVERWPVFHERA
ncbi:DSD1 family PLP-dependent enzyme [Proteobacteria bacterium 005FR1]|nr:DSD1 family PLP-dependent enzyme [Proteobacteria bacterium 005FR1]